MKASVPLDLSSPRAGTAAVVHATAFDDRPFPLLVVPRVDDVDLAGWVAADDGHVVDEWLVRHGAVLFRGFDVEDAEDFAAVVAAAGRPRLQYHDQYTPRRDLGRGVYTSTEYPPDHTVPFHSENSKNRAWPERLWFFARHPSATGGSTPLSDNAAVYAELPVDLRQEFEARGVRYVRTYGEGLGVSWPRAFGTYDRDEVVAACERMGATCEWLDETRLRVSHVAQAAVTHPITGARVWFNQASLFSVWTLDEAVRSSLLDAVGLDGLPGNAFFGDGGAIPRSAIEAVNGAYERCATSFAWERGDVLLVDNVRLAHGRHPFTGHREVLVAMT